MEKKKIKCKDCAKEFEFKPGKYTRKYCPKCSKQRKKDYDNLYKVTPGDCEEE